LQRLEKETLSSRNGEVYFFLTNEERDINREIKNVELNSGDESRLLGELIFDDVLKFEFYQLRSQGGQRFEMLGGCLDHPSPLCR
jgi:hypothetical protein